MELKELVLGFLNIGVIGGAMTVQLPQIRSMIHNKSAAGLSETMLILQTVSVTMSCLYSFLLGFPILTWAENVFLVAQMIALVILFWYYSNNTKQRTFQAFVTGGYIAFVVYCLSGRPKPSFLTLVAILPSPMIIMARIPQVAKNFKQGHTGTLSILSLSMAVCGNSARVATTIAQVSDLSVLAAHASALGINLTLMLQVLYYWKTTSAFLTAEKERKSD